MKHRDLGGEKVNSHARVVCSVHLCNLLFVVFRNDFLKVSLNHGVGCPVNLKDAKYSCIGFR